MNGLKLAAIYGFPPYRLGFCGPEGNQNLKTLTEFIRGNQSLAKKSQRILKQFIAAYPYYRLIAKSNKITNTFDKKVVEAYWIGNRLLEKVPNKDLIKMISVKFDQQKITKNIPTGTRAHHSFHVLFIGSVSGKLELNDRLRELCRIGWGKVVSIKCKVLTIKCRELRKENDRYFLSQLKNKKIIWDREVIPNLKIGQNVSFHWGRVCQILSVHQVNNLEKYTRINIKATNRRSL